MYLAVSGVKYQCSRGSVRREEGVSGSPFLRSLDSARKILDSNVHGALPQPHATLGSSLLFGGMGSLSRETRDDFSITSMTHITAVSGYNISILAVFFSSVGISLGLYRKQAVFVALLGIVSFVAMIGFQASAVRAALMGSLVLFATMLGRSTSANLGLIYAAAVMVAFQPLLLRWDIGFQLSFLATFGILTLVPLLSDRFPERNAASSLRDIIIVSGTAQIFVAPIIAYHFHTVSLVGILANIFVLWIVPFAMAGVGLVALSAFITPAFSAPFSWVSFAMLEYEVEAVHLFAQFPYGALKTVRPGGWLIAILYAALLPVVWCLWRRRQSECPSRSPLSEDV
jgi:competence protein ComEC